MRLGWLGTMNLTDGPRSRLCRVIELDRFDYLG